VAEKKKTSEAQIRAVRAWEARNKEKVKRDDYRRKAKAFIEDYATLEELETLKEYIAKKEEVLKAL